MIDRRTVDKILDAADIVDVVSDFVHLRKRGANYIGLCPFHNEKTPSFSVSRAKGICKCFSCGKGGSPVNFIMEHEQMSYYEALKYLAKKYNIEVVEKELTDKEKQEQSERENLLATNEFAMMQFEKNLFETNDGRNIGLSYFYERGFNDDIIKKFHLGYSMEANDALCNTIKKNGYNIQNAIHTGLCIQNGERIYDRFKGRVMFPVLNISGKVIAFGGRTLHPERDKAKYVNSPESIIYKKSNELYGLYQAKKAITKNDKCFLVEGYTDVLSMHQAGIENVVASSGTSLTEGQIRMIHRFTNDITVLYDGDSAGIRASLRGIDMLLSEGLNVKVLLLPDGDDPDSFAKKHNATEFQEFIAKNETDFIIFKTTILLQGLEDDPIKKAEAINDIIKSISVIPNIIQRNIYIKECGARFDMDEKILIREVNKMIKAQASGKKQPQQEIPEEKPVTAETLVKESQKTNKKVNKYILPFEEEVIRYVVKFGMMTFGYIADDEGGNSTGTVIEYIKSELERDGMEFSSELHSRIFEKSLSLVDSFIADSKEFEHELANKKAVMEMEGIDQIRQNCNNLDAIQQEEKKMHEKIEERLMEMKKNFQMSYLEKKLSSDIDDEIRKKSTDFTDEKLKLSKVHTKNGLVEKEEDKLTEIIPLAILAWKDAIISHEIKALQKQLRNPEIISDMNKMAECMKQLSDMLLLRSQFAKLLGDRVIIP